MPKNIKIHSSNITKRTLGFYLRLAAVMLLFFALWKPVFMLFNGAAGRGCGAGDFLSVIMHGFPLDLATTGYTLALPLLLLLVNIWVRVPGQRKIFLVYYAILSLTAGLVLVGDTCLYSFWDFKLDATVFTYLDSPDAVTDSVSGTYLAVGLTAVAFTAAALFLALRAVTPRSFSFTGRRRIAPTVVMILAGGLTFLGIRGGIGRSTANVGMVYYSSNQFLNHSAVNPAFSLFYSMRKAKDFSEYARYFEPAECDSLFAQLHYSTETAGGDTLLTTTRPNVLIIILEGFGGTFVGSLGAPGNVTPQFDRLTKEGVFFTNCYANSYRTDRGVLSTLSGYPSFPTVSVMKLPAESRNLPSIAKSLQNAGYATDFLYGGDINFTNMQSYLCSTGYEKVTGDTHFSAKERITHAWGVTDRIMFDYLLNDLKNRPAASSPWHTAFLTLASHEPWGVPYNRIPGDKKANAMAYLDDCIGKFIAAFKQTPQWRNTLVVLLPDHGIGYPAGLTEASPRRYHIPMLWLGGVIREPRRVEAICNQSDMAATLLGRLGIRHDAFRFSRDVLSDTYTYPTAYHTFDNGFAFIDSTGATVMDITGKHILTDEPSPSARRLQLGKAFLQKCFDDLSTLKNHKAGQQPAKD